MVMIYFFELWFVEAVETTLCPPGVAEAVAVAAAEAFSMSLIRFLV